MPTGLRIVLVMTIILLAPGFAAAQNAPPGNDQVKAWAHTCGDAAAAPDAVIQACTWLIEAGSRQPLDQAYAKRGPAYFLKKQDQEAMADFDRWVKLTPGDAQAYLNRGHLFFAEQRYEPAIKDYDHAITLEPENIAAWLGRGRAYFKAGYTDAALADANQAVKLNPEEPVALALRAACHVAKGDQQQGLADLQAAQKIDPDVTQRVWVY